jgi:prepilin signal peptidase PulO-like enzyme (type II secretory pathway)
MLLTYFEDATLTLAALPAPLHFCIAAIYGVVIGSFLTVVVHRLPIMLERAWQEETRLEDGVPLSRYNLCLPRRHVLTVEKSSSPGTTCLSLAIWLYGGAADSVACGSPRVICCSNSLRVRYRSALYGVSAGRGMRLPPLGVVHKCPF